MFNNLKKEIENDFDRNQNFNKIIEKAEPKKKSYWGYVLVTASAVVALELIILNTPIWNKDKLEVITENTIANMDSSEEFTKNTITEKKWIEKKVYVDTQTSSETSPVTNAIVEIKKWEDMPISQRYSRLEYLDNYYNTKQTEILEGKLDQYIGTTILTGIDSYTNNFYNISAEVYSIKNIALDCAVAVKFEGYADYYVYVNSLYRPETLGDFVNDLNLKEIVSFGTVTYKYSEKNTECQNIEFYDVKKDDIWNALFSNLELENVYSDTELNQYYPKYFEKEISISVNIPLLGYENIGITLTSKGYLITNILDTGKGFYIGEKKIEEFLKYIIENYDGYKCIYIYNNEDNVVEERKTDTEQKIMTIKNEVNTVPQEYQLNYNVITNTTKGYSTTNNTPSYSGTNSTLPYNPNN